MALLSLRRPIRNPSQPQQPQQQQQQQQIGFEKQKHFLFKSVSA
jgi:hypothetical protein